MFKNQSFRTKMLMFVLPITIIGLLTITFVSYYFFKSTLEKELVTGTEQNVAEISLNINGWLEERLLETEITAVSPTYKNIVNDQDSANKLNEYRLKLMNEKFPGTYDSVSWGFFDGSGRLSGMTASGPKIFENKTKTWYIDTMTGQKTSFLAPPVVSQATGKTIFNCISLIKNDANQNIGMVLAAVYVQAIEDKVQAMKFGDKGFGMLIAADGVFVVHPNQEYVMKKKISEVEDAEFQNLGKVMLESKSGVYRYKQQNENKIAFYQKIPLAGWSIAAVVDEAELFAPAKKILWTMMAISFVILLVLSLVIIFAATNLVAPLKIMMIAVDEMASGDFREKSRRFVSKDEFGRLGDSLASMRNHMRNLMKQVSESAEQLAASSEELTATAEQSAMASNQVADSISEVASGMTQQLIAVNETTNVVETMSASIEEVTANASIAAGKSAQAATTAQGGGKSVEQAINQMTQIQQATRTSAQVVTTLGERSKEIGQIVSTISGIAGQTNLLALNAAIEAARAGEQGRGFAVVAEEVRKLAEQSQDAAKQIATLINEIQTDTGKAVIAMNEGSRQVEIGTEVVSATGQAFKQISQMVMEVSAQVNGISIAIQQMANDSEHIVSSVRKIDGLSQKASDETQTVSASTEEQAASIQEIASASQSLAKMADGLQQAIRKFQI